MLTPEFQERIRWRDYLPWLVLLRTWEFAIRGTPMVCAVVATLLVWGIESAEHEAIGPHRIALATLALPAASLDSVPRWNVPPGALKVFWPYEAVIKDCTGAARLMTREPRLAALLLLSGLAQFAVWGWLGVIIARSAVAGLSDRRDSFPVAVTFGLRRWASSVGGPLLPLFAVAVMGLFVLVISLPGRVPYGVGAAWLWLISPILLLTGLAAAFLLGVLLISWPLIQTAVVIDRDCDGFNALSRVYNYITVRPWHLCWYVLVVAVTSPLVLLVVQWLEQTALAIMPGMALLGAGPGGNEARLPIALPWLLHLLVIAFSASYFWSAVGLTYVLLRRSVDGVPLEKLVSHDGSELNRDPYPVVGMAAAVPVPPSDAPPADPTPQ